MAETKNNLQDAEFWENSEFWDITDSEVNFKLQEKFWTLSLYLTILPFFGHNCELVSRNSGFRPLTYNSENKKSHNYLFYLYFILWRKWVFIPCGLIGKILDIVNKMQCSLCEIEIEKTVRSYSSDTYLLGQ